MKGSEELRGVLEALMFANGSPLAVDRMATVVEEKDHQKIRAALSELQMEYEMSGRALTIVEVAGGFQIVTRPAFADAIRKLAKTKQINRVSKPSLETLAIIAYKQPITRIELEGIRGVNVDGVVQTLLERRLIKIRGRKEVIGRPLLYGTTTDFLQYFGLKDLTELPKLEELPEVLGQLESTTQGLSAEPSSVPPISRDPVGPAGTTGHVPSPHVGEGE